MLWGVFTYYPNSILYLFNSAFKIGTKKKQFITELLFL